MGLKHFHVFLDKDLPIYAAEEAVSGRVMMSVDSPELILGVIIHFKGDTNVEWKKTWYNRESPVHTTTYTSNETYFDKRFNFLVAGECGETVILKGEHSYPFRAVLPGNLPASFDGKHGRVRYAVRAVCSVIKRTRHVELHSEACFVVIDSLDLNLLADAQLACCVYSEESFSSCRRGAGRVRVTVRAPIGGYVPGQQVPLSVTVDGAVKVISFTCTLVANLSYMATSPFHSVKEEQEKMLSLKYGAALRVRGDRWSLPFPVPAVPASGLRKCGIIQLSYELHVSGQVDGYKHTVDVKMPITIATIPFARIPRPDLLPTNLQAL